jgi:hypothetical protein
MPSSKARLAARRRALAEERITFSNSSVAFSHLPVAMSIPEQETRLRQGYGGQAEARSQNGLRSLCLLPCSLSRDRYFPASLLRLRFAISTMRPFSIT